MGSSASLERKPGGPDNWIEAVQGELPPYVREIARSVEKTGKSLEHAIAIAISRIKVWAAGGGNVSAKTRAKAAAALAAWEALKAKAKTKRAGKVAATNWADLEDAVNRVALTALEARCIELSADAGDEHGMVALSRVLDSASRH